jgi:hypothetical protein
MSAAGWSRILDVRGVRMKRRDIAIDDITLVEFVAA